MTVDEIYAELPAIECKGLCARSCGPVMCEISEATRMGAEFWTYELEGRDVAVLKVDRKLRCHKLRNGRCTVYEDRPASCRLWGVVESMECPWGCRPEKMLTFEEGHEILRRVREASQS